MGNCIRKSPNIFDIERNLICRDIPDKKAVLVGLNYTNTSASLRGCVNDAKRMERTLKYKYGYKDITVLTDKNFSKNVTILTKLNRLVGSGSKTMFFQYSGHGTQVEDIDGDESDGLDEALYGVGGDIITDDEINDSVKRVPKDSTMIMVIDACHSGTIIDLPYKLMDNGKIVKINNKSTIGNVICITGCKDDQTSADVTNKSTSYGAMSNALQTVIKKYKIKNYTWRDLVFAVRKELKKEKYSQIPQLCVSNPELVDRLVNI